MNPILTTVGVIGCRVRPGRRPSVWLVAVAALLLIYQVQASASQPASPTQEVATPADQITESVIESRRKEAEESADLDDETKAKIAESYRRALEELARSKALGSKGADFKARAEGVPKRFDDIKRRLEELKTLPVPQAPPNASLAELEQDVAKQSLRLTELKGILVSKDAEPTTRTNRRKEIRALFLSSPERLADVKKQLDTSPPTGEKPLRTLARRMELEARVLAIEQEAPALQAELSLYDAEEAADLLRLERDLCALEVASAQKQFKSLDDLVKEQRALAAQEDVRKAQEESINAQPLLRPYAEQNHKLAETAQALTLLIESTDDALVDAKGRLETLKKEFQQAKDKVKLVGLTSAIGVTLRKQSAQLPDVRKYEANVRDRRTVINDAQYELFEHDVRRAKLATPDVLIQEILTQATGLGEAKQQALEESTRAVLQRRQEYLDSLIRNYNKYVDTLVELDNTEQQLITETAACTQYISELVLWIRSGEPLHLQWQLDVSDLWFLSASQWINCGGKLWNGVQQPMFLAAALLLFGSLLGFRPRFRRELADIGQLVERRGFSQYVPTVRAAFLTVLTAAVWPGVVWYLSWRMTAAAGADVFALAVGQGLFAVASVYFPLEVFRQFCRHHGLAESHFAWPTSAVRALRVNLRWLALLGLPLVFVTTTLHASNPQYGPDSLERVCFILATIVLSLFLRQVLRPTGGVFKEYLAYHQNGWLDRLQDVWYWLGVLSPLSLAVLAYVGYYYTAEHLALRLYTTVWLVLGIILLRAFLFRLIVVRRRRLNMEQARQRRAAAVAAAQDKNEQADSIQPPEEEHLDLTTISEQTQRLLNASLVAVALAGVWIIWAEVLPAFYMLDRCVLWTTTVSVTEEVAEGVGVSQLRTVEQPQGITLTHLLFAIVIAAITIIAARNIPGLLEMSLLQRLPLDASIRYAITTLASYIIVLLGVVFAFGRIGVGWSQVQWLATALTFGLAFGLQEIFANFVAGLIILFERPVRVGDVVTVDDVSGTVTRIRIRATTITNWDRKEFLVPNKDFITGRLLNWTLSDKINRIVINVGIAYGSDTQLATDLLMKVVNGHPLTLDEPKSRVTFEGFGDNSLNFVVRTYLRDLDERLQTTHELHTAIDLAFREAGIEISFPQRDLHVRSLPDGFLSAPGPAAEQSGRDTPLNEATEP